MIEVSNTELVKCCLAIFIFLFIVLLVALHDLVKVTAWYKGQYYKQPRVNQGPELSRPAKLVFILFSIAKF